MGAEGGIEEKTGVVFNTLFTLRLFKDFFFPVRMQLHIQPIHLLDQLHCLWMGWRLTTVGLQERVGVRCSCHPCPALPEQSDLRGSPADWRKDMV